MGWCTSSGEYLVALLTRVLPPEEYCRLQGHSHLPGGQLPLPEMSSIVVLEDGIEIVGFWMLNLVPHVEPIWIDPRYRRSMAAGKLWRGMRALLDAVPVRKALCLLDNSEIAGYVQRLGFQLTGYQVFMYEEK